MSTFNLSDSCMTGYINNTLATAFMSNVNIKEDFKDLIEKGYNITQCRWHLFCWFWCKFCRWTLLVCSYRPIREMLYVHWMCIVYFSYKDYRSDEDQSLTSQFWLILALRFAFVILFEVQILQLFNLTLFYCMYLLTLALLCSFLVKHCLRSSVLLSLLSM